MANIEKKEYFKCESDIRRFMSDMSGRIEHDVISYSSEILDQCGDLSMVLEGLVQVLVENKIAIRSEEKDFLISMFERLGCLEADERTYFDEIGSMLDQIVMPG